MTIEAIIDSITRVSGVRMAALCTDDGIRVSSQALVGTGDENRVAAMSAEIGRAVLVLAQSWDGTDYKTAVFEASAGTLVVSDVGKAFVAVLADESANTGLLRLRAEQAASELRGIISAAQGPDGGAAPGEPKPGGIPPDGVTGSLSL